MEFRGLTHTAHTNISRLTHEPRTDSCETRQLSSPSPAITHSLFCQDNQRQFAKLIAQTHFLVIYVSLWTMPFVAVFLFRQWRFSLEAISQDSYQPGGVPYLFPGLQRPAFGHKEFSVIPLFTTSHTGDTLKRVILILNSALYFGKVTSST